jgi:hypothetical protein
MWWHQRRGRHRPGLRDPRLHHHDRAADAAAGGSRPALSGKWLVYRRVKNERRQIVLYNIRTGTARVIAHSRMRTDLGPPDISYPRVVYHRTTAGSSSITVYRIDRKSARSPRTTRIDSYFNPSIDGTSVVYIRQTLQGMQVEVLNLKTSRCASSTR